MKRFIYIPLLILLFCVFSFAQNNKTKDKTECPEINITGPAFSLSPGDTATFTIAVIGGNHKEKPEIEWTVKG